MLPVEIEKLIKKGEPRSVIVDVFYFFMFEGHQQYSEIKKIPIPLALKLMKLYDKKYKEMERDMKRKKR